MIQFGVYWSDVTVDHVLEIDPKTYCIVQRNSFKSSSQFDRFKMGGHRQNGCCIRLEFRRTAHLLPYDRFILIRYFEQNKVMEVRKN